MTSREKFQRIERTSKKIGSKNESPISTKALLPSVLSSSMSQHLCRAHEIEGKLIRTTWTRGYVEKKGKKDIIVPMELWYLRHFIVLNHKQIEFINLMNV